MTLNTYRDEVKEFLTRMDSLDGDNEEKIKWLNEEFELFKMAVSNSERAKIQHQLYDMLYLLFEIAADNDFDLDIEWNAGMKKKQIKYLNKKDKL